MKGKFMKRLVSLLLCGTMLISSGAVISAKSLEEQSQAPSLQGTISNLITGNFGAIGLEYLERGIMYGMGVAANSSNSTVSEIFSWTKRLLGNPQSNALGEIKKLCQQISQQIDALSWDMQANTSHLEANIQELQTSVDRNNYDGYHDQMVNFYNKYLGVYNDFTVLVDALETYCDDPSDSNYKALQTAYRTVEKFYTTTSDPHTGTEFNFTSDLTNYLQVISPYPANQIVDFTVKSSDDSAWGVSTHSTTYMDALYTYLTDGYAFEHDVYSNMTYGINEAVSYIAVYTNAYRMYVEFGAARINTNPTLTESERQKKLDDLWNDFNKNSYRAYRGVEQMASLYAGELRSYMQPRDVDYKLAMNYQSEIDGSIKELESNVVKHWTFKASKTQESMWVYQVKPINGDRTYAILQGNSSSEGHNNPKIVTNDLVSVAFEASWFADNRILNADFENLKSSHSPSGYQMLTSSSQLASMLNTTPYAKAEGNLVNFLKTQGLTNLPDVSTTTDTNHSDDRLKQGDFLIMNCDIKWSPSDNTISGNNDMDVVWSNISVPLYANKISDNDIRVEVEGDIYDTRDNGAGSKEFLTILSGNPKISFQWSTNSSSDGFTAVYQVDENGDTIPGTNLTVNHKYSPYNSGTPMVVVAKPVEGKVLKDITLSARDGSWSESLIGQGADDDDSVSVESLVQYLEKDKDGNYLIYFSTPYQDANIYVEYGDPDPEVAPHTVSLESSSKGDSQFANLNGQLEQEYMVGDEVEVNLRPYEGYLVDSITVTAADGTKLSVEESTDTQPRATPNTRSYVFTMPSQDVSVHVEYKTGYVATLQQQSGGSLAFDNISVLNEGWLSNPITYEAGDTVTVTATPNNSYYVSNFTVIGTQSYDAIPIGVNGNTMTFTMPQEPVTISAEYTPIVAGQYTVSVTHTGDGTLTLTEEDGTAINSPQRHYAVGDTVRIYVAAAENTEILTPVSVTLYGGSPVELNDEGNGYYSFIMPKGNVTVSAGFSSTEYAVQLKTEGSGTLRFHTEEGNLTVDKMDCEVGEKIYLQATPKEHFALSSIAALKGEETVELTDEGNGIYSFIMPLGEVTVQAEFENIQYQVSIESSQNGTVQFVVNENTVEGSQRNYDAGDTVRVQITLDAGYTLEEVKAIAADETSLEIRDEGNGYYSFTMPKQDVTISVKCGHYQLSLVQTPNAVILGTTSYFVTADEQKLDDPFYCVAGEKVYVQSSVKSVNSAYGKPALTLRTGNKEIPITYEGGNLYSFTMPHESAVVVVDIQRNSYFVSFQYHDGEQLKELVQQWIQHGNLAQSVDAPKLDGYRFLGWYLDGEPFDFTQPIKGNIVLTAQYEKISTGENISDLDDNSTPQTGDNTLIPMFAAAWGLSATLFSACLFIRRRMRKQGK